MSGFDETPSGDFALALREIPLLATVPAGAWSVTRLGGITNRNYRLQSGDRDYVLRLPGQGGHQYLNRAAGFHNAALADRIGIAPPVLFSDPVRGWQLSTFLAGSRSLEAADFHDPDILVRVGKLIGRLQASAAGFQNLMRPFEISDRYLALAPEPRLQRLRSDAAWLEAELESDPARLVPGHIDPNPTNFLRLADGELRLIDWEFSAMAHPCWDLAAIILDTDLTTVETDLLLDAAGYPLGQPSGPEMRRQAALFRTALCLVASSWAFVEIAAGNDAPDLRAFAEQRLEAFAAGLAP